MNIETANRLYQYRKKHHLSQEELAEKIGVSRQAVSKWERAEASPDTDNLIMLSKIYGVSLDELLGSESTNNDDKEDAKESGKGIHYTSDDGKKFDLNFTDDGIHINHSKSGDKTENDKTDDKTDTDKDHVSFKHGIHIHSKDGDKVDIGLGGIHVNDKNGDKVHVGWDGVHVESVDDNTHVHVDKNGVFVDENGKTTVYTDENGNVIINDERKNSKAYHFFKNFPYPIVTVIAYLLFGFLGICGGWAFGWLVFLTIPLYYTLVSAIHNRDASHFAYPVLIAMIYLWLGFFHMLWHPMWVLFLTIPIYYFICNFIKKSCRHIW